MTKGYHQDLVGWSSISKRALMTRFRYQSMLKDHRSNMSSSSTSTTTNSVNFWQAYHKSLQELKVHNWLHKFLLYFMTYTISKWTMLKLCCRTLKKIIFKCDKKLIKIEKRPSCSICLLKSIFQITKNRIVCTYQYQLRHYSAIVFIFICRYYNNSNIWKGKNIFNNNKKNRTNLQDLQPLPLPREDLISDHY